MARERGTRGTNNCAAALFVIKQLREDESTQTPKKGGKEGLPFTRPVEGVRIRECKTSILHVSQVEGRREKGGKESNLVPRPT